MNATPNPPATIDPEAFTVSRTITIAAAPDRVWAAITEPEHIAMWLGQSATLDKAAVGGTGKWSFDGYGDVPFVIEEMDPPRSIAYRWGSSKSPDVDPVVSTAFRFTLTPIDGGTQLHVIEWGFENLPDAQKQLSEHQEGWGAELDEMVAYLEGSQ